MDLTYMPGELDHKNPKKSNGSDMKREHDSVDDFEHLDPELSPVEIQQKDFSTVEKFDSKHDSLSEKPLSKNTIVPDPFFEGFSNEGLSSLKNPVEPLVDTVSGSKDFLSDLGSDYQQFNPKVGLNNQDQSSLLDFGVSGSFSPSSIDDNYEIDVQNKSFIAAEVAGNTNKTEHESDLLNLGSKAKDNVEDVQELPVVDDKKSSTDEKSTDKPMEFDNTKSMKEADALSQYDIKYERKTGGNKVELKEDDNNEQESFFQSEIRDPEPPANILPNLPKPEPQIREVSEPPKSEPLDHHGEPSDEVPVKPFIAICPAKPTTPSETTTVTEKNVSKKISVSDLDDIIGPEDVFKRIGLDAWFTPDRLHPLVEALVYWRDPKKSGVVFGGIMAILLSLCYMSLISVVAYSSLLALTGTICFRIYKNILQAVQKTSEGHPFKEFLDLELSLPQDKVREMADTAVVHVNAAIVELRRLFLVEDLIDSIKFGVCLWCLTYVGAIFNGMTIVILAFVALFTVPKIYENNKASIDTYIEMGRSKVAEITSKVKAAVPIGKKEPEKDKEQ